MSRGLAAIFAAAGSTGDDAELRRVPVELVRPNRRQPRHTIDAAELERLAATVRAHGVLQPVLVRPAHEGTYELVAGERRWRAAQLAGLATIPAIVRAHDDAAALEVALVENVARAQLSPIEDARACAALVEELGLTQEEVGLRTGRSRQTIANLLRLLDLPAEALEAIERRQLSAGHGRALLMAPTREARIRLAAHAVRNAVSVRELERRARAAAVRAAAASDTGLGPAAATVPDPSADSETRAIADELSELLGATVTIRRRGGALRAELALDSLDDARALAERMRAR
ncbi:ParB/RepB/Spo0J family partition protein [Conexibacter sp. CPCC 206217]|nr:ParB/RepB/Spo0J family partition protein [Conexibacter sp. CPCC 206217]